MTPRPPASVTAAASSGVDGPPAIGAWTIGWRSRSSMTGCGCYLLAGKQARLVATMPVRDAARSRETILAAAESLFSERAFEATSLSDVGAAAGLSRGTPRYFFGTKEQLYAAVLERVFAARQEATAAAFAPVHAWCDGDADTAALRSALRRATEGYMRFLLERPSFVRLLVWEELKAGER